MLFTHLDLAPQEKILHTVRRHWIVFLPHIFVTITLFLLPPIIYVVTLVFIPVQFFETIASHFFLGLFFYALWSLLLLLMLALNWTNYYLDVWYITDQRIIDINQKGIFDREITNLRFDKIQDISVEVRGVIATFLKYGNLQVQTAAEDSGDFMMRNAAHPEEVRKIIFEMHNNQGASASTIEDNSGIKL